MQAILFIFLAMIGLVKGFSPDSFVRSLNEEMLSLANPPSVPDSELDALLDLYTETHGVNWIWQNETAGNKWNFSGNPNPCFDRWQGIECTLLADESSYFITKLDLKRYNLSGSLPDSIGNLSHLEGLYLNLNFVQGTIPASIGQIQSLVNISLFDMWLSGPIPSDIWKLTNLTFLDLSFNFLTGTIPPMVANSSLEVLYLSSNHIGGTIPDSMNQLTNLQELGIEYTNVKGTIPASLGDLIQLRKLFLAINRLTGTIPAALSKLVNLQQFYANNNELKGPLPDELGALTAMLHLGLENNLLTGTLPPSLSQWNQLQSLNLQNNSFRGPLPAAWSNLSALERFVVADCALTGPLPVEYAALVSLTYLALSENGLTGSLPEIFANMSTLQRIDMSDNSLIGTFPATLLQARELVEIDLGGNLLHGSLPAQISILNRLEYLLLDNNSFIGTVPSEVKQLANLTELMVSGNFLSGSIDGLVDPSLQRFLSIVIINDNQFTGNIPESIFELRSLKTFVASTNCFRGALPDNICKRDTLTTLVLDGLSSSSSCGRALVPHGSKDAYVLTHVVKGSLPSCLFAMPVIYTLHLSGNSLYGKLPSNLTISPTLLYLSLSYNVLSGSIPAAMQEKQWKQLDLRFNRFDGSLLLSFGSAYLNDTLLAVKTTVNAYLIELTARYEVLLGQYVYELNDISEIEKYLSQKYAVALSQQEFDERGSLLHLDNNRLSGRVPQSLHDRANISVLGSNLFTCNAEKSDLPDQDSEVNRYGCGSRSFDVPYFIWLGCVGFTLCLIAALIHWRKPAERFIGVDYILQHTQHWLQVFSGYTPKVDEGKYSLKNVAVINNMLNLLLRITGWTLVFALVLLLPFYSLVSITNAIYLHQYSFKVSGAFLTGLTPVLCELALLILGLCLFLPSFTYFEKFLCEAKDNVHLDRVIVEKVMAVPERRKRWVNFQIHALYLLINTVIVVTVNVGFVLISLQYRSQIVFLAQLALSVFKVSWNSFIAIPVLKGLYHAVSRAYGIDRHFSENKFITLQMVVAIANYIVIPLAVIGVVDRSCYYNLFVPNDAVTAHYTTEYCAVYSYDLNDCLVNRLQLETSSYIPPFHYTYQCSSSLLTNYAPAFVFGAFLSTFVLPAINFIGQQLHRRATPGTRWFKFVDFFLPLILKPFPQEDETLVIAEGGTREFTAYFNVNRLFVVIITQFATMLTFGAWFPPLAVAIAVSIVVTIYLEKLKVGRFLAAMIKQKLYRYVYVIEIECQELGSLAQLLKQALWMMIVVKCSFCALFMFDTLGYAEGLERAYWVLIVVPLLPLCVLPVYWWRQHQQHLQREEEGKKKEEAERVKAPTGPILPGSANSNNSPTMPHFLSAQHRESDYREGSMNQQQGQGQGRGQQKDGAAGWWNFPVGLSSFFGAPAIAGVEMGTVSAMHQPTAAVNKTSPEADRRTEDGAV